MKCQIVPSVHFRFYGMRYGISGIDECIQSLVCIIYLFFRIHPVIDRCMWKRFLGTANLLPVSIATWNTRHLVIVWMLSVKFNLLYRYILIYPIHFWSLMRIVYFQFTCCMLLKICVLHGLQTHVLGRSVVEATPGIVQRINT